jgi:cyclic dehypoxanthinyl futalosine synthase
MHSIIKQKVQNQERISTGEALWLYENSSNLQLEKLAQIKKDQIHAEKKATYLVMSIINLTNICVAKCDYCAFYKLPNKPGGYFLSFAEICKRIELLNQFGGKLISFNSGFNPEYKIWDYAKIFNKLHIKYPQLTFFEMTIAEFIFTCQISKISFTKGAQILKDAGTTWIPGGGAEVLAPSFRKRHSPRKFSVETYFKAQQSILEGSIRSTATMVIGFDESLEERFTHLQTLRDFQEQQSLPLASFLCWTYKPYNNKLGGQEISLQEYLRWLAICRLYLDNFKHIRTSVLTKNSGAFQGLNYGADDFDIPIEDEVTQKAGASISHDIEALLAECVNVGFKPTARPPL